MKPALGLTVTGARSPRRSAALWVALVCALPGCASMQKERGHEDVARIAGHFSLEPARLVEAVKRGRVVIGLRAARPKGGGFLMAARDHEADPPPDAPEAP